LASRQVAAIAAFRLLVMPEIDVEALRAHLMEPLRGRKVILGYRYLASILPALGILDSLGCPKPMVIARGIGTGELPEPDAAVVHMMDMSTGSMTEEVRSLERLTLSPPAELLAAVDAYDPDHEAVWWLGAIGMNIPVDGRPVYGGRPPAWAALENKTTVEEIWEGVGASRAPSEVVDLRRDLSSVAQRLDTGDGTVWAGDTRDGTNGGGDYVRWVRDPVDARSAMEFFSAHCDRIRVMPFLEGVPCSIHGLVLPDGVVPLRPMELVTLRSLEQSRFMYGGLSTWWDPPDADREQMRELARRVGTLLRDLHGFAGAFGIDGVLTRDGFRPTELNSRFSGGLTVISRGIPELSLEMLQVNLVAGHDVGVTAVDLESPLVAATDRNRVGRAAAITDAVRPNESTTVPVISTDGRLSEAPHPDARLGEVVMGPTAVGALIHFVPKTGLLTRGMRIAPLNAAVMRFSDRHWGTTFGPVQVAPDVRAG
jgi:hypothetical protein